MKSPNGDCYQPKPLEIAAYLDGELDGQAHLAPLRRRIQEYLLEYPEAGAAALAQRRLGFLMRATSSPEPCEAAWDRIQARLEALPPPTPVFRRTWWPAAGILVATVLLGTAAAAVVAVVLMPPQPLPETGPQLAPMVVEVIQKKPLVELPSKQQSPSPPPKVDLEPFPVATADEIEIRSIGGADVKTLFVRYYPMDQPFPIVGQGEASIRRADPEVHMGQSGPPVIWVRPVEEEEIDP